MFIKSKFTDFYDWSSSVSHDNTDVTYDRTYRSHTVNSKDIKDKGLPYSDQMFFIIIGNLCYQFRPKHKSNGSFWRGYSLFSDHLESLTAMYGNASVLKKYKEFDTNLFTIGGSIDPRSLYKLEEIKGYQERSKEFYSKTQKTGQLKISTLLHKWLMEGSHVRVHEADLYRELLNTKAPVVVCLTDTYLSSSFEVHENPSLMLSGLSDLPTFQGVEMVAGIIDTYVSMQDDVQISEISNDSKIVGKGFDMKQSFRHRK